MNSNEAGGQTRPGFDPFTVSAVFCDGSETLIVHRLTAGAQAARDQVVMRTGGGVVTAPVFAGHLEEPDAPVSHAGGGAPPEGEARDQEDCA